MVIFFSVLIGLIILDFTLLGFLSYIFKMYPGYRHLLREGVLINDSTRSIVTNWKGDRYHSLILTKKHLILKNSLLTSVRNIDVDLIDLCTVKGKRKNRSKVTILFMDNNKKSNISFVSDKAENWVSSLRGMGVKVDM